MGRVVQVVHRAPEVEDSKEDEEQHRQHERKLDNGHAPLVPGESAHPLFDPPHVFPPSFPCLVPARTPALSTRRPDGRARFVDYVNTSMSAWNRPRTWRPSVAIRITAAIDTRD